MEIATETSKIPAQETTPEKLPMGIRGVSDVLEQHADWLDSNGETGIQADFSRESLAGADLVDARLQNANLNKTDLRRADLMLADLGEASLLQADLQGANLLGTEFRQANLQAANLTGATNLVGTQFAGSNLFGTVLPAATSPLEGLKNVGEVAYRSGWFLFWVLLLNALAWVRVFTTKDTPLLKNSATLPFLGLQTQVPMVPFYLFCPVLILGVYVWFHLYLQHLWDGAAQLPAIFPDGRNLDESLPWFAAWAARKHLKWLRAARSPLAFLEGGIATFLLYWLAPATVLLFWARYLTLQDPRGTIAHILLVTGAVAAALNFPRMVGKAFGSDSLRATLADRDSIKQGARIRTFAPVVTGLVLLLLSAGVIFGAPRKAGRSDVARQSGIKTWASAILWAAGYNPYAQWTETDVSSKPPAWTGADKDFPLVKGASLNRVNLRYAQAYGAFLAKARLWQADLRYSLFSQADLREANLRQADLRSAVLDGAKMARAALQEADLRYSNLNRADLQNANLSSANVSDASLLDATLDGATIYKADFRFATLQRASLKGADLRESNLENATLAGANLQETYLTSTKLANANLNRADLSLAMLTDADLRYSNLSSADLRGAILRGTNIRGANLQHANLMGAVGITAEQICSTGNFKLAQLDDNLQREVDATCGTAQPPPPTPTPNKN